MDFMKKIGSLVEKIQQYQSLADLFSDVGGVLVVDSSSTVSVNGIADSTEVIILDQHINTNPRGGATNSLSFAPIHRIDEKKFELRTVINLKTTLGSFKYDATVFSHHGGDSHQKWFVFNRKDSISIQTEENANFVIPNYNHLVAVYCIVDKNISSTSFNAEVLNHIGGQNKVYCECHKYPLIYSVDRKNKCACGKKEHFSCPELQCNNCICQSCIDRIPLMTEQIFVNNHNDQNINNGDNENSEINSQSSNETRDFDSDCSDSDSEVFNIDENDIVDVMDRDYFDDFMINGGIVDDELCGSDEEDSFGEIDDMPTTSAGDLPFEVIDETPKKAVHISGHVILNQCGSVLTRKKHELKGSSLHKHFLQRICATSDGKAVSLLYPEGMLFPSIFYNMVNGAIIGAIPAPLLTESISSFGFASLPEHIRSRLTSSSSQSSTNPRYISFCYDTMVNLTANHSDTRIVLNRGLHVGNNETNNPSSSTGLSVRGKIDSGMLESIDSKQMVKNLTAAQKFYLMDYFVTFTCNQKMYFGTKPIKEWLDSGRWKKNYKNFEHGLTEEEKKELKWP